MMSENSGSSIEMANASPRQGYSSVNRDENDATSAAEAEAPVPTQRQHYQLQDCVAQGTRIFQ